MRNVGITLACCFLLAFAAPALAQSEPAPAPVEPVLSRIPDGALAFVVVRDVEGAMGRLDAWLSDTGLLESIREEEGPDALADGTLAALAEELKLGDGFRPDGGVALVVMDPEPLGVELMDLIPEGLVTTRPSRHTMMRREALQEARGTTGPSEPMSVEARAATTQPATTQPATAPAAGQEGPTTRPAPNVRLGEPSEEQFREWLGRLPVVLLVPGESPETVLPNLEAATDGGRSTLTVEEATFYADQFGGYVALSPLSEALDALVASDAAMELAPKHRGIVEEADIACYADMARAGALFETFIEGLEGSPVGVVAPLTALLMARGGQSFDLYREQIAQMEDVVGGLRIGETGVVGDMLVKWDEQGEYARRLTSYRPADDLVANLPNFPYILALGMSTPREGDLLAERLEALLAKPEAQELPEANREELLRVVRKLDEQVHTYQFAATRLPETAAAGIAGGVCVLRGEDADACRATLRELLKAFEDAVHDTEPEDPDAQGFRVVYEEAGDTEGERPVDTFTFETAAGPGGFMESMLMHMLGQDALRFRVSSPRDDLLVISIGGGAEMHAEAARVAVEAPGGIADAAGSDEAMEHMPAGRHSLMLFNLGNYFKAISRVMMSQGGPSVGPMPEFEKPVPVAIASGADGAAERTGLYVSTQTVKNVMSWVRAVSQRMRSGPERTPPPGAEDF